MPELLRTKAGGASLDLVKGPGGPCELHVSWPAIAGDIDAVAFVETASGQKHVLQPLDNYYGSLTEPPFVQHGGDQRAGGSEHIRFFNDPGRYRRILLWVFKYPCQDLAQTQAMAALAQPGGNTIIVDIDAVPRKTKGLVVAQIVSDGHTIQVVPPATNKMYFRDKWTASVHEQVDKAYGWNFSWRTGTKS